MTAQKFYVHDRPVNLLIEREPLRNVTGAVRQVDVATVFLYASRCPVGCTMCDLHQYTHEGPTPRGAIPDQIRFAQAEIGPTPWIKLYNSGNFFDLASIPRADFSRIIQLCEPYERVIVENHPRFGISHHASFSQALEGRLEVAVGLESVHPRVLHRIGKGMSRDQFDQYAASLKNLKIDLRVFLMVGAPGQTISDSICWARLSIRHALSVGARHISLIPARVGAGWAGQGGELPEMPIDLLCQLFADALGDVADQACLSIDLWDLETESPLKEKLERAILRQDASEL